MEIKLKLNGKIVTGHVEPDTVLLDFLRQKGCLSVKRGCDTSNCGLCTVDILGDYASVKLRSYTAAMEDEEVEEFFTQMVTEQVKAQYAAQVQAQLAGTEAAQLAAAQGALAVLFGVEEAGGLPRKAGVGNAAVYVVLGNNIGKFGFKEGDRGACAKR